MRDQKLNVCNPEHLISMFPSPGIVRSHYCKVVVIAGVQRIFFSRKVSIVPVGVAGVGGLSETTGYSFRPFRERVFAIFCNTNFIFYD